MIWIQDPNDDGFFYNLDKYFEIIIVLNSKKEFWINMYRNNKSHPESIGPFKSKEDSINWLKSVQVPEKDHWIYKNPKALESLMRGIKDAEEGRLNDIGSFSKYVKDNEDKKQ